MVTRRIPCIVIAGTQSGSGKTSIAIGIGAALTRRGLRVQPFKVGPDYLDPGYLTCATGRTCYNLDGWMCGKQYVRELVNRVAYDADVILIEGVMGLFDGASPVALDGSTAEIADWLGIPIYLVAPSHGMARSFAAQVKGFCEFDKRIKVAGIIANRCGSARHVDLLKKSVEDAGLPSFLGGIPVNGLPQLDSRHLGLVSVSERILTPEKVGEIADAVDTYLDMEGLRAWAAAECSIEVSSIPVDRSERQCFKIAVAKDDAFQFVYPDFIDAMEAHGAELVYFSPLVDSALPGDISALFLCGGYPEMYAEKLSANRQMIQSIVDFDRSGGIVYAECGGLMYLCESIETMNEGVYPMCGIIASGTRMLAQKRALGYREVTTVIDTFLGPRGTTIRGHEFHYSELCGDPVSVEELTNAFSVTKSDGTFADTIGFHRGNVLASYVHLHLASNPAACKAFTSACRNVNRLTIKSQGSA